MASLTEQAIGRLRAAADELEQAARREGIEPDGPLGVMIGVQKGMCYALADTLDAFEIRVAVVAANMKQASEAEFARQHAAMEETKFQLTHARGVVRDFDIEKTRMANEMLVQAIPKLVKGVRDAVAVREVWVSRGAMLRQAVIAGMVAVSLVVGGYAWRMVQVWNVSDAALRNSEGIEVCKATSHWVDPQGHRLCRLDAFTAREADAK